MPSLSSASAHAISVKAFRWRIWEKKSLGPRDPKHTSRAEYWGLWTRQRQTVFLYSTSLSLKTLDTEILLLAVFKLELEMDYSSETGLCIVAPSPDKHPFSDFFWGEGAAVHRVSETDNPSSNCPSKLTDKVRRIVHSKLKPFPFQIIRRITYLMRIIKRITHLTRIRL